MLGLTLITLFFLICKLLFLCLIGVLLHFEDPSLKLTDCYFIHPEWLSQMMAQVVTVKEINPYVDDNGVLNRENLPILFKGENFPDAFIDSYLRYVTLLGQWSLRYRRQSCSCRGGVWVIALFGRGLHFEECAK